MHVALTLPALALAAGAAAQVHELAIESRAHDLDSGYRANPGERPAVVFHGRVRVAGAAWLRLYFDRTNLPDGSRLRLTSAADDAVQWLDAGSLRDYGHSSAYFNGGEVRIELVAGPATRANRVAVARVELERHVLAAPETICGSTDDRRPVTDARIGRGVSGTSACTWWLINEFTILTAGHCAGMSGTPLIGFNIPLSDSLGRLRHPPPDDQYPLDVRSRRRLNSGVGRDWAVVAALRNSNHKLYPGQKQKAWFELGAVPSQTSGVTIRITGNGRVSPPISPTWNAATKTHTGPLALISSTALGYRTDTSGGNSGSPVIHEQTGKAIGIHTHGGCSRSGGRNLGTRIDRSDLRAAIAAVTGSKVAGAFDVFGQGCAGTAGTARLGFSGVPDIGQQLAVEMSSLPRNQIGALAIGASNTTWQGRRLPLDLRSVGIEGCTLYVSIDLTFALGTAAGSTAFRTTLPVDRTLVSRRVYFQYFAGDPGARRTVPVVTTNGGEVFVGG